MKIICTLLIFFIFGFLSINAQSTDYCLANADPQTGEVCFPLIAGQNLDIGQVCIGLGSLIIRTSTRSATTTARDVTVSTSEWLIDIVHLWVGLNLADAPVTNTGNPIPGQFPYICYPTGDMHECVVEIGFEDIYGIGYDPSVPCDDTIWFALHASVHRVLEDGSWDSQTAWGQGTRFTDRGNWGMYNSVYVLCDCQQNPCTDPAGCDLGCETAFAKSADKSQCFLDIPNIPSFNRWGWTNGKYNTNVEGQYSMDIWAAAGQCDTTKGTLVGQLHVTVTLQSIAVSYDLSVGFVLQETHLYVGTTILPHVQQGNKLVYTVAPGQYPYSHENLEDVVSDSYTIPNNFAGAQIYIVAHAVVCSESF
jgi:hypothetical protein